MKIRIKKDNLRGIKTYFWWAIAGILGIITIFITIETSTSGFEVAKLEGIGSNLIQENRELSDKLISNMSLSALENKTNELGFAKPEQVLYINGNEQVAKLP